jgi:hypothetical protein
MVLALEGLRSGMFCAYSHDWTKHVFSRLKTAYDIYIMNRREKISIPSLSATFPPRSFSLSTRCSSSFDSTKIHTKL